MACGLSGRPSRQDQRQRPKRNRKSHTHEQTDTDGHRDKHIHTHTRASVLCLNAVNITMNEKRDTTPGMQRCKMADSNDLPQ